jgi:hypothetical protein
LDQGSLQQLLLVKLWNFEGTSLLQVYQMLLPGGSMHSIPHILSGGRDPDLARFAVHDPASNQQDTAAAPEGLLRLVCVRQVFRSLHF